jgi:hypothetical protein
VGDIGQNFEDLSVDYPISGTAVERQDNRSLRQLTKMAEASRYLLATTKEESDSIIDNVAIRKCLNRPDVWWGWR